MNEKHADDVAVQHFGSIAAVAAALSVTRQALYARREAGKPILSVDDVLALEKASDGALTRSQMRPDLWPDVA